MNDNFLLHASWLHQQTEGMQVLRLDAAVVIDSGLPCDTFNIVTGTTPAVARVIDHFGGRPFSWWCEGPNQHLRDNGFEPAESELAMSFDLGRLDETFPTSLRIDRVRTSAELLDFARINAANWTPPDENVLRFYERVAHAALRSDSPLRYYLGYVDDTPVATAELTIAGDVGGIYNISTLQAYRRRGVGTAMTNHLLREAFGEGLDTAILQAAPMGAGIYRRLGFRESGTIIEYKLTTRSSSSPSS